MGVAKSQLHPSGWSHALDHNDRAADMVGSCPASPSYLDPVWPWPQCKQPAAGRQCIRPCQPGFQSPAWPEMRSRPRRATACGWVSHEEVYKGKNDCPRQLRGAPPCALRVSACRGLRWCRGTAGSAAQCPAGSVASGLAAHRCRHTAGLLEALITYLSLPQSQCHCRQCHLAGTRRADMQCLFWEAGSSGARLGA